MSASTSETAARLVREDVAAVLAVPGRLAVLEPLRQARLTVTGGTGFLGTWLLELVAALNRDHGFGIHAAIFSRFPQVFRERHGKLAADRAFTFIAGDVRGPFDLPRETTHLIHAAAITNGNEFASVPTRVAAVNGMGAVHLFDAARRLAEPQRVVLISSGLVYGPQPLDLPRLPERSSALSGLGDVKGVYAASKRFAESVAAAAVSEGKLPVTIARPFAFVGPHLALHLPWAITDFFRDALHGGPLRIMGDGTTVRSLLYASDFAWAILALAARGEEREAYNVGSPEGIDLLSLAQKIAALPPSAPEIQTGRGQTAGNPSRFVPETRKIEALLGGPLVSVPLDRALERTMEWYRTSPRIDNRA